MIYGTRESTVTFNNRRVTDGLAAFYSFTGGKGNLVRDLSGSTPPSDLYIENQLYTNWLPGQGLSIDGNTIVISPESPQELIQAVMESNEISLEAWIRTSDLNQSGPASIISLSENEHHTLFFLGQDGNHAYFNYVAGTGISSGNGGVPPYAVAGREFLSVNLHHVVYTRDRTGSERIYINGAEEFSGTGYGNSVPLQGDYRLVIGNDREGQNPWMGVYYLVAVYDRDISGSEVSDNYNAGPGEIQYSLDLLVDPASAYEITPFARTNQGIAYGPSKDLAMEELLSLQPSDSIYMFLYPVPSGGDFKVHLDFQGDHNDPLFLRVVDMKGQIVYSERIYADDHPSASGSAVQFHSASNSSDVLYHLELDVTLSGGITDGIYSVIVNTGKSSVSRRLLVTR